MKCSRTLTILAAMAMVFVFAGSVSRQWVRAQEPPSTAENNPDDSANSTQDDAVLPPDIATNDALVEVIRLSQSGVSEDVIANYIHNVQYKFNLTTEQIIYLKDIGLPDSLVTDMIQRDAELGPDDSTSPPETAPPTTEDLTDDDFYGSLAPYGTWVVVGNYGRCWRPSVVVYDSSWQPYCDHGHWIYTNDGWYWSSDYSWGWVPFHYGRWFHDTHLGWCWRPGRVWAPSWVCWRYSNDYCGWAPLPPNCTYRAGVGLVFNGAHVGVGFSFGLGASAFTFVPTRNFCDPHPRRHRVFGRDVDRIFHHTTVVNHFDRHQNIVVNHGISPQHISNVTHAPIHPVTIHETSSRVRPGEREHNGMLFVHRPHFTHFNRNQNPPQIRHDNNQPHINPPRANGEVTHNPPPNTHTPPNHNGNENPPHRNQSPSRGNPPLFHRNPNPPHAHQPLQNRNMPQPNRPAPPLNENRNFPRHEPPHQNENHSFNRPPSSNPSWQNRQQQHYLPPRMQGQLSRPHYYPQSRHDTPQINQHQASPHRPSFHQSPPHHYNTPQSPPHFSRPEPQPRNNNSPRQQQQRQDHRNH